MTLAQRLNAPDPPAVLDAVDVEMRSMSLGPYSPPVSFTWHRPDGTSLWYRRWVDDDGERFYLPDEFMRRADFA